MQVAVDGLVLLLLYLIAAPAMLVHFAPAAVRSALLNQLRHEMTRRVGLPVILGLSLVVLALLVRDAAPPASRIPIVVGDLVLLALLVLAIYATLRVFPLFRSEEVVGLLSQKLLVQARRQKKLSNEDLEAMTRFGVDGGADEKERVVETLGGIIVTLVNQSSYQGGQLGSLLAALQNIVLPGNTPASNGASLAAVHALAGVSDSFKARVKTQPDFSDADLSLACRLAGKIGQAAVVSLEEPVYSACIRFLSCSEPLRPASTRALCEIGTAAVPANCMEAGAAALQVLEKAVTASNPPVEQHLLFAYAGLLAAFWSHGETARAAAKHQLDRLKQITNLRQLIGDAVQHHSRAGQFTTADHIRDMWDGYLRIA